MIGRTERRVGHAILIIGAAGAVLPFVGVLLMALGPSSTVHASLSITSAYHFSNFVEVWKAANFGGSLLSSTIITVATVILTVAISVPAGYAFATMRFWGNRLIFYIILLGLLTPLEGLIIPLYFDMRSVGLADNYWAVILPETALSISFGCFWMRAFFLSTPRSLVEAARMDGAGVWVTLRAVLLPLARPHLLTLAVLVFVWNWNGLLLPLVMLSGSDIRTAPMSLVFFQGQFETNFTYQAGAAVITAVPVFLVYLVLQRSFSEGIVSGAIKG